MVVSPVVPIVPNVIAVVLPVVSNIVAAVAPIIADLVPIALRKLAGTLATVAHAGFTAESIAELVASLVGRKLSRTRPLAKTGQRRRSVAETVRGTGADCGTSPQGGQIGRARTVTAASPPGVRTP
jgi:hypothetical protein